MSNTELPNTAPNAEKQTGIIAYFANNSVAANLMMIFIVVMGIISFLNIQRQMFPNVEINYINIEANYPGASPREIEESILIKIEESLKDVTEIKKGVYRAFRNGGRASLEINTDVELTDILDKVKLRVDGIATFPAGMEPVTISQVEFRQDVIGMTLVADIPLTELKPIANQIEDELLQLSNVSLVVNDVPLDEIAIEIEPDTPEPLEPDMTDTAPPELSSPVTPPVTVTLPPAVPCPTEISRLPALPCAASPDAIDTDPDAPLLAAPDATATSPLLEPSAECTDTAPLDDDALAPL